MADKDNENVDMVEYTIGLIEKQNEYLASQVNKIQENSDNIYQQTQAILTLSKNSQNQYDIFEKQAIAIDKLATAIGSDNENSLIGQISRMRTDINDNHKNFTQQVANCSQRQTNFLTNLAKSVLKHQTEKSQQFQAELFDKLDKVSEIISKSATEQVINALKEVISDFNHNLTEQFGENFKELNKAVFKLVEWQDKYTIQIEQMIKQYEQGVLAIMHTKEAVMTIENSTQAIPTTMEKLSDILKVNQHQIDEINRHLHAFGELQQKAVQALPKTQEHIELMLQGIQTANQNMVNGMNDVYVEMTDKLQEYNTQVQQDLKNGNATIVNGMRDVYVSMSEQLTVYNNSIQNDLKENHHSILNAIEQTNQSIVETLFYIYQTTVMVIIFNKYYQEILIKVESFI